MFSPFHLSSPLRISLRAISTGLALLCLLIFAAGVQAQDSFVHGARSPKASSAEKQALSMQARAVGGQASRGKLYDYLKPEPLQIRRLTAPDKPQPQAHGLEQSLHSVTAQALNPPPGEIAQLTSPVNGSTFNSWVVDFHWTQPFAPYGSIQFFLDLSSSPGSRDIFAGYVNIDSALITGIPVDGRTIYVRLWTNINGVWLYNSYTYKAKS